MTPLHSTPARPAGRLTEAQFTAVLARAGKTKSVVKQALRSHLVNGECLNAVALRYGVNRGNLYAKLKKMGMSDKRKQTTPGSDVT